MCVCFLWAIFYHSRKAVRPYSRRFIIFNVASFLHHMIACRSLPRKTRYLDTFSKYEYFYSKIDSLSNFLFIAYNSKGRLLDRIKLISYTAITWKNFYDDFLTLMISYLAVADMARKLLLRTRHVPYTDRSVNRRSRARRVDAHMEPAGINRLKSEPWENWSAFNKQQHHLLRSGRCGIYSDHFID